MCTLCADEVACIRTPHHAASPAYKPHMQCTHYATAFHQAAFFTAAPQLLAVRMCHASNTSEPCLCTPQSPVTSPGPHCCCGAIYIHTHPPAPCTSISTSHVALPFVHMHREADHPPPGLGQVWTSRGPCAGQQAVTCLEGPAHAGRPRHVPCLAAGCSCHHAG